jgi:hypothetical protein
MRPSHLVSPRSSLCSSLPSCDPCVSHSQLSNCLKLIHLGGHSFSVAQRTQPGVDHLARPPSGRDLGWKDRLLAEHSGPAFHNPGKDTLSLLPLATSFGTGESVPDHLGGQGCGCPCLDSQVEDEIIAGSGLGEATGRGTLEASASFPEGLGQLLPVAPEPTHQPGSSSSLPSLHQQIGEVPT